MDDFLRDVNVEALEITDRGAIVLKVLDSAEKLPSAASFLSRCWAYLQNNSPVSYTHLDVYKRQVLNDVVVGALVFFLVTAFVTAHTSIRGISVPIILFLICLLYTSRCV